MTFTEGLINGKIINIHTGFAGKVTAVSGNTAKILPLNYSKNTAGELKEQSIVEAYIPENVKVKETSITYRVGSSGSKTTTVIVPDNIVVGDIVYCGVAERDISSATLTGKITEPTRHHDMSDSVILAVLRSGY